MKTLTTCMQCQAEAGIPNFSALALAEIPENGIIEITCDRGHRTATIIQESKFEILSEMGVKALVDGSYRDAVSSFASTLERLYEYFIEAACRKQGISPGVFSASWKAMASQSERQLGAFLAAFLLDTRETPKLLPQKQVELRNSVVHKGRFPTSDEASKFGAAMFDCALPVLQVLRSSSYAETIQTLTSERVRDRSKQARHAGRTTSTMSMATPLSFVLADQPADFGAIVASYAGRPDLERAVRESRQVGELVDRFAAGPPGQQ